MRVFTIGKDDGCEVCVLINDEDDVDVRGRDARGESFSAAVDPLAAAFEGTDRPRPFCLPTTTTHKQAITKMEGILMSTSTCCVTVAPLSTNQFWCWFSGLEAQICYSHIKD